MDNNKEELHFQAKLKDIYKTQDKIAPLIEGLDKIPQQSMKDYYVKLQTIIKEDNDKKHGNYEEISGDKKKIELRDLFIKEANDNSDKEPQKLLILGGAGVGKTTILQYIAYKWSVGELWADKFDYMYRASLKSLLNPQWTSSPWAYEPHQRNHSLLKCLIHHTLCLNLSYGEIKKLIPPERLPWGENKRILLLLDGYDEIAHLANDDDYKRIEEEIFEHDYVIMTSRPNAVNNMLKEKFDRKLENMGLDDSGIEQYFRQYFRDTPQKGADLDSFLSGNPVIKSICKIPVNIAMLCYIWSESESSAKLNEISRVSSLYQEVVSQLGRRYFAKQYKGEKAEGYRLEEKLENGQFILDELKVLTYTAYNSMTGGGLRASDDGSAETLIIRGCLDNQKDERGISIQSSINFLASQGLLHDDQRRKTTVTDVFKYGLLKVEGAVTSSSNAKSGPDFLNQTYSFIHLTFQECLTANYLKELLKKGTEQEKSEVCGYIADRRNEPRYLMTLKFMAGVITDEANPEDPEHKLQTMFWDAMTCNIDGLIELGIETKVSLLMHLLSQAKVGGAIDPRIPHNQDIVNLIDAVVLSDLGNWSNQLRESDYMSENIKEGILTGLLGDYVQWYSDKIQQIQAKSSPELQAAMKILVEAKRSKEEDKKNKQGTQTENSMISAMERASMFYVKLNLKELHAVMEKLETIISQHKTQEWQLVRKALEVFTRLFETVKKGLKSSDEGLICIKNLSELISDSNFAGEAQEAIYTVFNATVEKKGENKIDLDYLIGAMFNLLDIIPSVNENIKASIFEVMNDIRKAVEGNKELGERARKTILRILEETDSSVPNIVCRLIAAVRCLYLRLKEEEVLAQSVEEISKFFQRYPEKHISEEVAQTLDEISRATTNQKIKEAALQKLQEWACDNTDRKDYWVLRLKYFLLAEQNSPAEIIKLSELLFKEIISANETEALNNKMRVFKDLIESPRYSELELALSQKIFATISPKENITINKTGLRYIFIMICDNVLKHQDRKNEFCKQFISLLSVDDAELLSLILSTLSDTYNRFDYNAIVCSFEKVTALLSHKDKRVKMNAIKSMGAMNSHFKYHPQLQSRFGLSVLANIASVLSDHDEEILTNAIENIYNGFSITYFGDDRSTVSTCNEEEREFLIQLLDKIAKLLSHNNITIQQKASSVLFQMAMKYMTDETVRKHTFTIVSNYFSSEEESVRINSVHTARVILDEGLDSDLDALFLENTKELLSTDYIVACTALRVLLRSIKKAGGKDLAPQMFLDAVDIIKNLDQSGIGHSFATILESQDNELIALNSEPLLNFRNDGDVYKDRIYMLMGIVKKTKDKDLATRVVNKMTNFLTNQDEMAELFFHCISEVIEFMQDKKLAADLYKQFFIASDQHFQLKVIGSISKLLFSAQDKQLVAQAFKLLSKILSDRVAEIKCANNPEQSSNCSREINNCAKAIYNIVLCFKDKEVTSQGLKDLLRLLEELPEKEQEETISLISDITTKYFLVPSEDILKCLRHPLYSLSSSIEENLTKSFGDLLKLINSVEKAIKETQDTDTNSLQRIKDSLMSGSTRIFRLRRVQSPWSEIFRDTIDQIKENINTFKNAKSTAEDVIKFKESVISTLNKAMKGYELIEIALVVIGHQESGIQNQELIELSRKVLNLQIKCLDDQGLKWINSNVETLATLSGESKLFFKRLYHKLLQDKVITPLEKTLIIKLINQGLTTSISRKGEIILEGKKYVIEGENIMSILEEIARAVIEQEKDVLGIQYRTHIPIFAKSVSSGIKKASSDIRAVYSVVDKSHKLSSDGWLLTKLDDNSEEMAIVVEQRSAIGDHLVFQVKKKKMMRIIPGGRTTKTELEDIFGKHTSLGRKYSGSSILLTNQEATQLINGQSLDYSSRISKAQTKSYFLDELLGQGNQDRLAYLEEELASKLTDHEKGVTSALKKSGITPEDRAKLKDYYKAFIGTFASIYTTSQVVDSGQVTLNAGDTAATLLSTLVSFAPFIGNTLSSSITSIAEFLKSQEMLKSARKMKNLASDTVSLNQLIGECAYQLVLKTKKQKEILGITDEELQKISGSVIDKITKFYENMGEKVDEYLYGRMYSTAAAKLGNNDANKAIQAWIKGDMNLESIQEQFIKIATGEKSKESPSPSKAKENDETEAKRSSCCQLF